MAIKGDGKLTDIMKKVLGDRAILSEYDKQYDENVIDFLALKVTSEFDDKIVDNIINVEDIQDIVEEVLSKAGYTDVAKAYILYRKLHEKMRNMKSTILDYKDVVNADLVGKFGNFFNRTLNMIYKNFNGELNFEITNDTVLDENDKEMIDAIKNMPKEIAKNYSETEFRQAYKNIMKFASIGNTYLEKTAPWSLIKQERFDDVRKILYLCLNMAKSLAIVANPIIPTRTQEIWTEQINLNGNLNGEVDFFEACNINISKTHKINPPKPLYARVDDERLEQLKTELSEPFDLNSLKKNK